MLTPKEVEKLRDELLNCKRPLFLYHDDPDGLASFLLCYRFLKEGRGLPVKAYPKITKEPFARKVEDYGADKVFVLDVAMMEEEFVYAVKVPIVWVDHHELQDVERVLYLNPQKREINVPTPVLIWQVMGEDRPQDLWLAVTGAVGDWFLPDFAEEFRQGFPDLLPPQCPNVEEALFNSKVGTLVKVFSFNLKGPVGEVLKAVKVLARIENPYEILEQQSPKGKFLWKRYLAVNKLYESYLTEALKNDSNNPIFVYTYSDDKLSLTKDVANELLYKLKKVIIVGREKSGEYRCSLRSPEGVDLLSALEKALSGVEGYGGGHTNACGAAIKKEDFDKFVENLKRELGYT